MDNFIDKFAQRKNAQELIRANAMAEAEEKEKLTAKLSEYELAIQELRRCSLQNLENSEKVKELLMASLNKIEEVQKKDDGEAGKLAALLEIQQTQMTGLLERQQSQVAGLLEKQQTQMGGLMTEQKDRTEEVLKELKTVFEEQNAQTKELMEAQQKAIEELLHAAEEFNHKEAVKVYRNVQAVIEGALPKQTEEIRETIREAQKGQGTSAGLIIIGLLTFAAAAANVVIEVLKILGYL